MTAFVKPINSDRQSNSFLISAFVLLLLPNEVHRSPRKFLLRLVGGLNVVELLEHP